ncbi:MAG: hypothetical protein ACR2OV_16560, partial [Hyphomicrobiaceae bacterium]
CCPIADSGATRGSLVHKKCRLSGAKTTKTKTKQSDLRTPYVIPTPGRIVLIAVSSKFPTAICCTVFEQTVHMPKNNCYRIAYEGSLAF